MVAPGALPVAVFAAWPDKVTGRQCLEPAKERGLVNLVSAKGGDMPAMGTRRTIETTPVGMVEATHVD